MAHVNVVNKGERVMDTTFGMALNYISLIGVNIRPTPAQVKLRDKKLTAAIEYLGSKYLLAKPMGKLKNGQRR